jgi:transcriptional regulator with XRE-family HTH domain
MRELRRLREAAGLSLDQAGQRLDFSKSKIYRLENGRSRISTDDLEDMLDLYGVRSPERDALLQLGRDARRRGWWTAYSDVFTGSYVGLESEAACIKINAQLIPGFLQTEEYARSVIGRTRRTLDAAEVDRRITARTARRQALFDRSTPPQIHIVLDEATIRREVGGAEVVRHQLAAVIDASERSNITIQVLPFTAGAHAGMEGEFVVLDFPDPEDPSVAYVEGLMGDLYLESEGELELFDGAWTHVVEEALNVDDSLALLGPYSVL